MIAPLVAQQLEELRAAAGDAVQWNERPDSTVWVHVPDVELPKGWSVARCAVSFLAPVGYPQARLDCFYADEGLRLAGGGMPANANVQFDPNGQSKLWFSYHVSHWDPNRDTLVTYLNVIKQRLREVR